MAPSSEASSTSPPSLLSPQSPHVEEVMALSGHEDMQVDEVSKSVYEEDEVASLSGSDGDSDAEEGVQVGGEGDSDAFGTRLLSEELPLSLNLKSGDFEFRDQITWSVLLPVDLNGYDCHDYVAYNLENPMIDLFALRTVEEMDLPIGFDISLARSIRAQLMTLIPIVWRERQVVALQERRNSSIQRAKKVDLSETKIAAVLEGKASRTVREEVVQLIASRTEYPVQALRRLLSGDEVEEMPKSEEAAALDLDEVELAEFKKRKRSAEDEAANGRKKRKRGTAFEAHVLCDERIPIRLNLAIAGVQLQDRFDWDPSAPLHWADTFARRLSTELGLTREFELAIAHDIKRQVLAYLAHTAHQLPPEWNPTHTSASVQANAQASTPTAQPIRNQPNTSNNDGNRLGTSSGSISRQTTITEARNSAPNIPNAALPILSLHNVIRPPQSCNAYAPSLSLHSTSKLRWDRMQAKRKAHHTKPSSSAAASSASPSQVASTSSSPHTTSALRTTQSPATPKQTPQR